MPTPKRVPFNLNDDVWVKLTPRGEQIYFESLRQDGYPSWNQPDKRGFVHFQMHEFMSIFGAHISPYAFGAPFDMNIEITYRQDMISLQE